MTVTTSLPAAGIITRSIGDQSSKLSAVLNNKSVESTAAPNASVASAQVQVAASTEQQPPLNLRVDTLSIAYVGSKTDVVDNGATQVSRLLDQLQSLATRASLGGLSESALELLNGQFQALRLSISNVPPAPPEKVGVADLLGQVPGGLESELGQQAVAEKLTVGGFNDDKAILGTANLLTQSAAIEAVATIASAQELVASQSVLIGKVKEVIDFASASAETAIQNQSALLSTLDESDLEDSGATLQSLLQAQPDAAKLAQTAKLPANVLNLLS